MARTDEERFKVQYIRLKREAQEKMKKIGEEIRKSVAKPQPLPTKITKRDAELTKKLRRIIVPKKKKGVKKLTPTQIQAQQTKLLRERLKQAKLQQQIKQQRMAEAEMIAQQQDPRFQQDFDQWEDGQVIPQQELAETYPEVQTKEQLRAFTQRFGDGVRNIRARFGQMGRPRYPNQPQQMPRTIEEAREIQRQSNILNTPFIFGESNRGVSPRISLMGSERTTPKARNIFREDPYERKILNTNLADNPLSVDFKKRIIGFS